MKLAIEYAKYEEYRQSRYPDYLKSTEEEVTMDLCKGLNITKDKALSMKISDVYIYQLANEKADFMQWYCFNKDKD